MILITLDRINELFPKSINYICFWPTAYDKIEQQSCNN